MTAKKKKTEIPQQPAGVVDEVQKVKRRGLVPSNGENRVMTPAPLAQQLVDHFAAQMTGGYILDPARGQGAFLEALKTRCAVTSLKWAEVDAGIDFFDTKNWWGCVMKRDTLKDTKLDHVDKFSFIITNPPWEKLLNWWIRGMELADNVVYLCLVPNVFQKAKRNAIRNAGFGIKEIAYVKTPPPKTPWPQAGFCLGAVHVQRGYKGGIKETFLPDYDA
jgi:hypothetical protein